MILIDSCWSFGGVDYVAYELFGVGVNQMIMILKSGGGVSQITNP